MSNLRRVIWLVAFQCVFLTKNADAQGQRAPDHRRYLLWFTPTGKNSVEIDGVAVGLFSEVPGDEGNLRVNGVNVEVLPFAVIMFFGASIYTMLCVIDDTLLPEAPSRYTTEIYGFSLSAGMLEEVHTVGLTWNFLSYVGDSRGVEMSMVMNSNHTFGGVQAAVIGNRAMEGTGFQLGGFNTCGNCHNIVQFGILNRIGNRVLPLVNFSFGGGKRAKRTTPRRQTN